MVFGSLKWVGLQRYLQSISEAFDALLNDLLSILRGRVKSSERPLGGSWRAFGGLARRLFKASNSSSEHMPRAFQRPFYKVCNLKLQSFVMGPSKALRRPPISAQGLQWLLGALYIGPVWALYELFYRPCMGLMYVVQRLWVICTGHSKALQIGWHIRDSIATW